MTEARKREKIEMMYNQTVNSAPSLRAEGEEPIVPGPKEHIYDIRISARTKTQKALVWIVLIYMVLSIIVSAVYLGYQLIKKIF